MQAWEQAPTQLLKHAKEHAIQGRSGGCKGRAWHLDDAVGHAHLLAQRRQPDDQLHWVHVVRDGHQLRHEESEEHSVDRFVV